MWEVLIVTFPFFALVLAGYGAGVKGLLPINAIPGLNTFVLYFALPCMLFRFGASTPLAKLLDLPLFLTYLVCALLIVSFTVAVSLNPRIRWNDSAFGALVAAFPNTGFMGVPLLVTLLGPGAAGPAIVLITIDMMFTTSLCIGMSRFDVAGSHGSGAAVRKALRGIVVNPLPWAILLGAVTSGLNLPWPEPVLKTIGLLADAASPAALFTLGAVLARSSLTHRAALQADPKHARSPIKDHIKVVFIKLLLHPLLLLLLGSVVIAQGIDLDPFALHVAVLVAALPSASNVVMLAERFTADSGRIARIVLDTTALSFLTFSGVVVLLQ